MIEVHDLGHRYGQSDYTFRHVSFSVGPREVVALMGPSGAGKSTLLRCLNCLCKPCEGTVTINSITFNASVATREDVVTLRRQSAMVFQGFHLFKNKTVLENVMLAPVHVKKIDPLQAQEEAFNLLDRVGMRAFAGAYPYRLSGGQQQRVAIARALAVNPAVLLLDEPTSALDPRSTEDVLALIGDLAGHENMAMVIVTHEMSFAKQAAHQVIFLRDGGIGARGAFDEVFGGERRFDR